MQGGDECVSNLGLGSIDKGGGGGDMDECGLK